MKKTSRIFLFLATTLFLNGCIYIKLFKLKGQLENFDQNFEFDKSEGLQIKFLNPIFSEKDIKELKVVVAMDEKTELGHNWQIIFQKVFENNKLSDNEFNIKFTLNFVNHKMVRLDISETYFSLIPKDLIVEFLKSIGNSKINKQEKKITTTTQISADIDLKVPTKEDITKTLGEPFKININGENCELIYKYFFKVPGTEPNLNDQDLDFYQLSFLINETDKNISIDGKIPVLGEIKYTLSKNGIENFKKKSNQKPSEN